LGGQRGKLISKPDRVKAIELISEAIKSGATQEKACIEIGISSRTYQRWTEDIEACEDKRPNAKRKEPQNKLSKEEELAIIETCNQPEYRSLPPSQIVPKLADKKIYLASESTFYRVLKKFKQQHHRGRSKKPVKKAISTHKATGPNQVWMWDITWLQGPAKGIYFYLYLLLDLYSRKIVAWEIWTEESTENASILVRRAVMSEKRTNYNSPLVLHSDNGSPMKGASLLETLYTLGITPSRSRPRVSNDNPYAESIFRTVKYCPSYPNGGFISLDSARGWVLEFVRWYNTEHQHSGISYVTPEQRHNGKAAEILLSRKSVYETARAKNPERWTKNVRTWKFHETVWLNPEKEISENSVESSVS